MKPSIILLVIVIPFQLFSQTFRRANIQISPGIDSLVQTNHLISESGNPSDRQKSMSLYVVTDKSIYLPNETVWFSAYEFNNPQPDDEYHPFFAMIADRYSDKILWSGRFLQKNAYAAGSFLIPDSLADGDYVLIGYNDKYIRGNARAIFYKNIYIRSMRPAVFSILPFEREPQIKNDSILLRYLISSPRPGYSAGCLVDYEFSVDGLQEKEGRVITDRSGQAAIKFKYKKQWMGKRMEITLHVSKDGVFKTLTLSVADPLECLSDRPCMKTYIPEADDKFYISFDHLQPKKNYRVIIYNDADTVYTSDFYLRKPEGQLRLPMDSFPDGYIHIALLDSAKNMLTENTMMLEKRKAQCRFVVDSQYNSRAMVSVKIICKDNMGKAVKSVLSLSCAYNRRIKGGVSIVKKYYYNDVKYPDLFKNINNEGFGGQVSYLGSLPKKKVDIVLMGGDRYETLQTDSAGKFKIEPVQMEARSRKDLIVSVTGEEPDNYLLKLQEPDKDVNDSLSRKNYKVNDLAAEMDTDAVISAQEKNEWKKTLQTAVVKAAPLKDGGLLGPAYLPGDPCADDAWVCSCGHWKCNGCPPALKPIKGHTYISRDGPFIYQGCPDPPVKTYIKKIQPIVLAQEFAVSDNKDDSVTNLNSTLFWKPFVRLDENGQATLEFPTNDLKGKFSIIAEGASAIGPVHESIDFFVK